MQVRGTKSPFPLGPLRAPICGTSHAVESMRTDLAAGMLALPPARIGMRYVLTAYLSPTLLRNIALPED